jgi:hypothetical protein
VTEVTEGEDDGRHHERWTCSAQNSRSQYLPGRAGRIAGSREGHAIVAARRRLPMIEVDGATPLIGEILTAA